MGAEENKVVIELHSRIDDHYEIEESTAKTSGVLYTKGQMNVVKYTEDLDEDGDLTVHNLLTIQPEKVSVKRSGAMQMHQQFVNGQTTECLLQHPHGSIHMETYTKSIHHQPIHQQGPGRLTIDYLVTLNGQETRNQQLTWTLNRYE